MEQQTAEQKAAEAAASLAAEGVSVTARMVRERAGVNMKAAGEAARAWNEEQAAAAQAPELPQSVLTRVQGVWIEALSVASAAFESDRQGWDAQRQVVAAEVERLEDDVATVEAERDAAREAGAVLQAELDAIRLQLAGVEREAAKTEGRAEQAEKAQEKAEQAVRVALAAQAKAEEETRSALAEMAKAARA